MKYTFLLFALLFVAPIAQAEDKMIADITCKLFGPNADWKYKKIAELHLPLHASHLAKAERKTTEDGGCYDDEFLTLEEMSADGKVRLKVTANVCGNSDVYFFATLKSDYLFPVQGQMNFSVDSKQEQRLTLGSEGQKEAKIELNGEKLRFVYLDCGPTKK